MEITKKQLSFLYYLQRQGGVISQIHKVTEKNSWINMAVLRSCEKKGFVKDHQSHFEITEKGKKALLTNPVEPYPPLPIDVLMTNFEYIKQNSDDEGIHSIINEFVWRYINRKY